MLLKKEGFPEEGELVMCTVTSVQVHSVFANLDEYEKSGMIHISEVSPGRIRNIRDFVKEGKKIVCKVLRINLERGHIDLSLRRVSENQRRQKVDELKQEQNAEKIVEFVAKNINSTTEELFKKVSEKALENYDTVYSCFQDISKDNSLIEDLELPKKTAEHLLEIINQRIKPPEIVLSGKLKLITYAPDGVEIVKSCLDKAHKVDPEHIDVRYLGSGAYKLEVKSQDYKTAEKLIEKAVDTATKLIEKHDGTAEFSRESA